jgi:hypothetical protein
MNYDQRVLTLPPGQTISIPFVGSTVAVLEASNAFAIGVNDDDPRPINAGLKLQPKGGFEKVRVLNPSGSDVTITLGLALGDITDSRLQASGNINVRDPGAGGESFADVIAAIDASTNADVVAMMQNADDQRIGAVPRGASEASGQIQTTPTMLINPATNTNGAIIRTAVINTVGNYGGICRGTSAPSGYWDKALLFGNSDALVLPNQVYLSAGEGLWALGLANFYGYSVTWDYL